MRQQTGKEEVEELLVRLSKSEDTEIKFEAQHYLTSFYITSQRFEEAEEVLALLPDFDFNARHLQALLLYMKKDYEAAKKAVEQLRLYADFEQLDSLVKERGFVQADYVSFDKWYIVEYHKLK